MTTESKFNRTKFKNTANSGELKAADKSVEDVIRSGQKGHYAGFLQIEPGMNKLLLYPSHEAIQQMTSEEDIKNEPFIVPKQVYWLPREVEDKDDKGEVKKDKHGKAITKVKNMPVYDARIHSEVKRDIVDFYINTLKKQLEDEFGTDKKSEEIIKQKMLPIFGSFQQKVMGIIAKPSWIMYVQKMVGDQKIFGRIEIGKAVKMRLNELIAIEEANAPIGSESNNPFTDINDRRALLVKFDDKANDARLYYTTEIDSTMDKDPKSPTYKQIATFPLSDAELEEFLNFPSLSSLYKNCYTKKDFDLALSGLVLFDDKNEFGICSNQDFLDEAEVMRNLYPDPKEESQETEVESNKEEVNMFDAMNRDEMKEFSRKNKTGILVHSKLLDDDLRNQLKEWDKRNNSVESVPEVVETIVETKKTDIEEILDKRQSAEGVKNTGSTGETAAQRIAKIRAAKKNNQL